MMKKNRLLAAFLALVLALGTLAVPIAFADVSGTVTTDVTDSAKLADLEISSNYTVSATLSGITPSLAQNLASDNLFKNSGTTLKVVRGSDNTEITVGHDKPTQVYGKGTENLPYITDGIIDNGKLATDADGNASYCYTYQNFVPAADNSVQGYLTFGLDGEYKLDDIYLFSYNGALRTIVSYEVYIGSNVSTLYEEANKVLSFNYNGYPTTKLNSNSGYSEGQYFSFTNEKPVGSFIGYKIIDSTGATDVPNWLYISEAGAHGDKIVVSDDIPADKREYFTYSDSYDTYLQTSDITVDTISELYADSFLTGNGTMVLGSTAGASDLGNSFSGTYRSITDGGIDNNGAWNSGSFFYTSDKMPQTTPQGYLTLTLKNSYVFDKLYIMSAHRAAAALCNYEVYIGDDKDTLYTDANHVYSFNYSGYYTVWNDDAAAKATKLNHANDNKNSEGQIYTFNGDTKPTGKYIGIKINDAASTTYYPGWFYISEIGALGIQRDAATVEATVNANDDTVVSPTRYVVGSNYKFTVDVKNAGSVTKVTANGAELTANESGYYTVGNAPENITIAVETTRDSYAPKNNIWNGKDVTMRSSGYYNPTWNQEKFGNESVMRDETVMFYSGRTSAKLLYPIDNIVSVYTYDLTDGKRQKFYLGEDFTVNADGEMVLTDSTNIPVYANGDKLNNITTNESGGYTTDWSFIGAMKTVQPQYLISVTYTHTREWSGTEYGTAPDSQLGNLKFSNKAASGETTNVLFLGDSITTGCNATGQDIVTFNYNGGADVTVGSSPSMVIKGWEQYLGYSSGKTRPEWTQSAWANLVVDGLKAQYGNDNITITNRGIGSSASAWYYKNIEAIVNKDVVAKPDLVFIAFGMNEAGNTKATQKANVQKIIDYIREWNPDCSVVLVSAFSPNMYTASANPQPTTARLGEQEEGYKELAETDDNMAYAPVFSEFQKIRAIKEGVDYTGNNYNHVNDFGVNLYANTILAVLDKEEVTHTVTFLNKNGTVLGTEAVADGSAVSVNKAAEYAANADEIFGYTKGINGNFWDSDITLPITADMTFTAVYTKNDVSAVLTVEDNGTKTENHSFDERVSVTAEKTEGFLGWRDKSSGAVLSTSRKYTFYLPGEIDLEAVYESDGVNSLTVDSSVLNTSVHYAATDVGYKATVTGISAVPTGATITEKGFVITNRTGYAAANGEVTLNMATKQIETANKPANGNYMLTIAINAGQKRYVRAYVTYTLNGVSHTEYSKHTAFINYTAS